MPDEQSNNCDELPEGLTHVTAAETLMPSACAVRRFTSSATWRRRACTLASCTTGESSCPLMSTPSSRSASQFSFHIGRRPGKYVAMDWMVPMIDANSTFSLSDSSVSSWRATAMDRLQNSQGRREISPQLWATKPLASKELGPGTEQS